MVKKFSGIFMFLLVGCSSSYEIYDSVDQSYCDKIKINYSLSELGKDVCLDTYIKDYTKINSSPKDVADSAVYECRKVVSIYAKDAYDAAVCVMAKQDGMSVQKTRTIVNRYANDQILANTETVNKDALNRVIKFQSTIK